MRKWVELFDEPRPHSAVFSRVVDFVPVGKILVHRELEVHTVYQRFLAGKDLYTPQDISACLYQMCSYRLQA